MAEHLRVEDDVVYPALIDHTEPSVRAISQLPLKRIGGIGRAFDSYVSDWEESSSIEANPSRLIGETRGMMRALKNRIEREDEELYPLVDRFA